MDFSNRNFRGAQQPSSPKVNPTDTGRGAQDIMRVPHVTHILIMIATALLVLVLIISLIFVNTDDTAENLEKNLIQSDKYQAVFLDSQDGQVYFGKLAIFNKDLYVLNDIYYVRVENPIQPAADADQQANISLAKLGSELHCPADAMFISRDKVLYWENLEDEGQVVRAITEYLDSDRQVNCNPTQTQDPSTQQTQPAGTDQQTETDTLQDGSTPTDPTTGQ